MEMFKKAAALVAIAMCAILSAVLIAVIGVANYVNLGATWAVDQICNIGSIVSMWANIDVPIMAIKPTDV